MTLTFHIHSPVDAVFRFLTDMQQFVSVHPVINRIEQMNDNHFLVHETLRLLFIPFSFTYTAIIEKDDNEKEVWMQVRIMKRTSICIGYQLLAAGNTTVIKEYLHVQSPLPLKGIIQNIFRKQHTQLFNNIEHTIKTQHSCQTH